MMRLITKKTEREFKDRMRNLILERDFYKYESRAKEESFNRTIRNLGETYSNLMVDLAEFVEELVREEMVLNFKNQSK